MSSRRSGALALGAALAALGCAQQEAASSGPAEAVRSAERAAERSRGCAAELDRAAGEDPQAVARALAIAPAVLAPHGERAAAPVRAEVAERLERARADAVAAGSLARVAEDAGAAADAGRRAVRSLAVSTELCRAADLVRDGRLARAR